jgi:hypothetical protein
VIATVKWDAVGSPTGYVVARWDDSDSRWWVLRGDGTARHEWFSTFLGRDRATLGTAYAGLVLHVPGRLQYTLEDQTTHIHGGTHYQVIAYSQPLAAISQYTTLAPASDVGWLSQPPTDHRVKLRRRYYLAPKTRTMNVQRANAVTHARFKIETNVAGQSYAALSGFGLSWTKTRVLELCGAPSLAVEGEVRAHDISQNVAIWT